jgi:uncharacterized protein (DUF1501 family)
VIVGKANMDNSFPGLVDRRTLLRAGAVGAVGLSLPQLLRAERNARAPRERSCILIFAWGGPHHLDTFDPKPEAPGDVRGPYGSIQTAAAGMRLVDQFPRLAKAAKLFSIVRSISHSTGDHNAASYLALTGRMPPPNPPVLLPAAPGDFPALGSILAKLKPTDGHIPPYVSAPVTPHNLKVVAPGHRAGFLGEVYNPFVVAGNDKTGSFETPALALPQGVDPSRLAARRALKEGLEGQLNLLEKSLSAKKLDSHFEKAFALISSPQAKQAFDVRQEPKAIRDRYGNHTLGQSLLLARRLVEAGVRIVMVNDAAANGDVFRWDTHNDNNVVPALKRNLPETDGALSALLEDLHERGLLESTLVVWMGEMGRTPKGRTGHWPQCYPAVLAGAGIQGGRVHGASDRIGAFPKAGRCTPADIHATIYHAMGLPGDAVITDPTGREIPLYAGDPIQALF